MPVTLVISKTLTGGQAADALLGGGNGYDLGPTINGQYAPLINQIANTGWANLYVSHDAVTDPITAVGTYIQQFSQTYGGSFTAAADFALLQTEGGASDFDSRNLTGNGQGLRIEHRADPSGLLGVAAFDGTQAQVRIYGHDYGGGAVGVSLATAVPLDVSAEVYNNSGVETLATAPVAGKIGKAGDTVLGDHAHLKLRSYLNAAATLAGTIQWDFVTKYAFTA